MDFGSTLTIRQPNDGKIRQRIRLSGSRANLSCLDSNRSRIDGIRIVVARFGLFLQSLHSGQPDLSLLGNGISPWIDTTLIAMGIVVNLWCAAGHIRLVRQLKRGESDFEPPSAVVITVALVLAILGLAMRSISCESANQTLFARKNQ
jgi:uncharacterized membrane protein YidH (DUF202 family)